MQIIIFIAINGNGKLFEPFVILNTNFINPNENTRNIFDLSYEIMDEISNEKIMLRFLEKSRIFSENTIKLLIMPTYKFLDDKKILDFIIAKHIPILKILQGLGCFLNPLREIIPIFTQNILNSATESDLVKKHQNLELSEILHWVSSAFRMSHKAELSEILSRSFDNFFA